MGKMKGLWQDGVEDVLAQVYAGAMTSVEAIALLGRKYNLSYDEAQVLVEDACNERDRDESEVLSTEH